MKNIVFDSLVEEMRDFAGEFVTDKLVSQWWLLFSFFGEDEEQMRKTMITTIKRAKGELPPYDPPISDEEFLRMLEAN